MNNLTIGNFFAIVRQLWIFYSLIYSVFGGLLYAQGADKTDDWLASINGLGPVKVGMSLEEISGLVGELEKQQGDGEGCVYYSSLNSERDISFMLFAGHLVRVDIYSRKTATLSSVRVGDSAERIKQIYAGAIKVFEQAGNPNGELIYLASGSPEYSQNRFVFETNHDVVTNYRFGLLPYVNWKEGCVGER